MCMCVWGGTFKGVTSMLSKTPPVYSLSGGMFWSSSKRRSEQGAQKGEREEPSSVQAPEEAPGTKYLELHWGGPGRLSLHTHSHAPPLAAPTPHSSPPAAAQAAAT